MGMKGLGQEQDVGVMSQGTHLHGHGLPRAVDFDTSLVHGAQVHQNGPVILIQQHVGGLQVPMGMDVTKRLLGPLPTPLPLTGAARPLPVRIALAVDGLQPAADAMEDEKNPLLWHEGPFLSQCFHLTPEGSPLAKASSRSPTAAPSSKGMGAATGAPLTFT